MPLTPKEFNQLSTAIFQGSGHYYVAEGLIISVEKALKMIAAFVDPTPNITITTTEKLGELNLHVDYLDPRLLDVPIFQMDEPTE